MRGRGNAVRLQAVLADATSGLATGSAITLAISSPFADLAIRSAAAPGKHPAIGLHAREREARSGNA
jgi:hypothetical protein